MLRILPEKIRERVTSAHTEAEWIVEGIKERLKGILRARALQRDYPNIFQASAALNNQQLDLFPDEINQSLQLVAEGILEKESTKTDQLERVIAANYLMNSGTRRWASRSSVNI